MELRILKLESGVVFLQPESEDDSLAQLVEHSPFKAGVQGSSPWRVTESITIFDFRF